MKNEVGIPFVPVMRGPIPSIKVGYGRTVTILPALAQTNWITGLQAVPGMGPGSGTTLTSPENEEGALADILVVDGNPLEDMKVLGGQDKWFTDKETPKPIETLRVIMKDGVIYKNTL